MCFSFQSLVSTCQGLFNRLTINLSSQLSLKLIHEYLIGSYFMNHTFSFVIQHPLFNLHTS